MNKQEIKDKVQELSEMCEAEGYGFVGAVTDGDATLHAIQGPALTVGYLAKSIAMSIEKETPGVTVDDLAAMYAIKHYDGGGSDAMDLLKDLIGDITDSEDED